MKNNDIEVSVICTAYNHEKFLRKCLDGFVCQKTNFKFEVVVHEDASTDGTKAIIEEYVKNYPEIIVPIYQTENQYSKRINIVDNIILPKTKGKYIALCEGDDFWCDENKLQLQYDFMEKNLDCSACLHNSIMRDLNGKEQDRLFNDKTELYYLTPEDVIKTQGMVHTSSYFVRREFFKEPELKNQYWFGDYVRLTFWLTKGRLAVLPYVMSVYNWNNSGGVMCSINHNNDYESSLKKLNLLIDYLNEFNELSNFAYKDIVDEKIKLIGYNNLVFELEKRALNDESGSVLKKLVKKIKHSPCYKAEIKRASFLGKVKKIIKYNVPMWMFKILIKKRRCN